MDDIPAATQSEETPSTSIRKIDVVSILGVVGGMPIIFVFLNSLAAVGYGSGMLLDLGFPLSDIRITSLFQMATIQPQMLTIFLLVVAFLGFGVFSASARVMNTSSGKHIPDIITAVTGGLAILLTVCMKYPTHPRSFGIAILVTFASVVGSFCVYFLSSDASRRAISTGLFGIVVLLSFFVTNLINGTLASELLKKSSVAEAEAPWTRYAHRSWRPLTLVSKEKIPLLKGELKDETGSYVYAPNAERYVAMISFDDDRYYLVEKSDAKIRLFMLKKDIVSAIEFMPRPVF